MAEERLPQVHATLSGAAEGAERREALLYAGLALLLAVLTLLPLWSVRFPPLQDYPNHLWRIHIIQNYHAWGYAQHFRLSLIPLPNLLADVLMTALAGVTSVAVAGKIVLSLALVGLPASVFYLVDAVDPEKRPLGFFAFPLAYNWYFAMGFINFALSLPLALVALGLWWRHRDAARPPVVALAGVLMLVYFAHFVTFLTVALILLCLALVPHPRNSRGEFSGTPSKQPETAAQASGSPRLFRGGRGTPGARRRLWGVVAALAPTGLAYAALLLLMRWSPTERAEMPLIFYYHSLRGRLRQVIEVFLTYSPAREYIIGRLVLFLGTVLLAAGIADLIKKRNGLIAWLPAPIAALVLVYALPVGSPAGDYYTYQRTFIVLLLTALPLLRCPRRETARLALVTTLVALTVWRTAVVFDDYRRLDRIAHAYHAVLMEIPPGQRIYPLTFAQVEPFGRVEPFRHFWAYYHLARGGISPYAFTLVFTPIKYHRLLPRPTAPGRPCPAVDVYQPYILTVGPGIYRPEEYAACGQRRAVRVGPLSFYARPAPAQRVPLRYDVEFHTYYDYLVGYGMLKPAQAAVVHGPRYRMIAAADRAHLYVRLPVLGSRDQ
ncbi:MAG: hypothetical protein HY660_03745 [Armatimonadetes bacterium]|nr:hypothetical protein [Armatimonadota bacterium]